MKRWLVLVGLFAVAAVWIGYLGFDPAPSVNGAVGGRSIPSDTSGKDDTPRVGVDSATTFPTEDSREDPSGTSITETGESDRVRLHPSAVLYGTVTDPLGVPVPDARLSWVSIPPELAAADPDRALIAEQVRQQSLQAVTDSEGRYSFEKAPEHGAGEALLVWITHASHAPRAVVVPADTVPDPSPLDCQLPIADPVDAVVVSTSGESIAKAQVRQEGLSAHLIEEPPEAGMSAARLSWLLSRVSTTNETGRTALQIMPGVQRVTATEEDLRSTPWTGVAESEVRLEIGAPVVVSGVIREGTELEDGQEMQLRFEAVLGERVVELERFEASLGDWGPVSLPYLRADEYRVCLDGSFLMPKVARFHPSPGERLAIDLDAEYGYIQWFFVSNADEEVLPESEVTLRWRVDDRFVENRANAREDGYIVIGGLPPGTIEGEIRCPGYVSRAIDPLLVPDSTESTFTYTLRRARSLRGKVLADGAPVQDFEIHVWPVEREFEATHHSFTDSDGSFEIGEAPASAVALMASAAGLGISDPVTVERSSDPDQELVLSLATDVRAHGRVVDGETRAVIPDAAAQVRVASNTLALADLGVPRPANTGGEFRLTGLSAGQSIVRVTAPGYSSRVIEFSTRRGEDVDLGVIPLVAKQPFDVWLMMNEGDPTQVVLEVAGPELHERRPFDEKKRVHFEAVNPGSYGLHARLPNGSSIDRYIQVPPGKPWSDVLDASGDSTVVAEVNGYGETPPTELTLVATTRRKGRYTSRSAAFDENGRVVLRNLPACEALLTVYALGDEEHGSLAKRSIELEPGTEEAVSFEIGKNDKVLRVVDPDGNPIPGVLVAIHVGKSTIQWEDELWTDTNGECIVRSLDRDDVLVHLRHPTHGYRLGIPVPMSGPEKVIELVLHGDIDATFVVSDFDGPVVGATGELYDVSDRHLLSAPFTDESGRITWHKVSEGTYNIWFDDPRHWPLTQKVQVLREQGPIPVRLVRRCSLDVLTRSGGLPRAGVHLSLVWTPDEFDVAKMLDYQQADSSTGTLTTGTDGRLRLDRIPEGEYRWDATADGATVSGVFEVHPDSGSELVVDLP